MTTEQYEKAKQTYQHISSLKDLINTVSNYPNAVRVDVDGVQNHDYWFDPVIRNDIEAYKEVNRAAIRAELLDVFKDHLKRLEDELNEI